MWKFCGKAQFPHSFGRHTRKSGEITVFFAVKYMRKTMVKIWLQLPLIISCIQIRINFNISLKTWESPFSKQKYPGHIFNSFLDHTLCRKGRFQKFIIRICKLFRMFWSLVSAGKKMLFCSNNQKIPQKSRLTILP